MKRQAKRIELPEIVHPLDDKRWLESPLGHRSAELTPLYIERYHGNRVDPRMLSRPYWEFTVAIEGSFTMHVPKQTIAMVPGTLCLIPPGIPAREEAAHSTDSIWLAFNARKMPDNLKTAPHTIHSPSLAHMVEQLWLFAEKTFGPTGPELDAQTANIVNRFLRQLVEDERLRKRDPLERAIQYLLQNYTEPLDIAKVAQRFGYSEGYFYRSFKKRTGVAPNTFLVRARIQQAVLLLQETDLTVADIGVQVGYPNPMYFSRIFRRVTNRSPLAYRTQIKAGLKRKESTGKIFPQDDQGTAGNV
jgi:AraC-like DNA-binding protein